MADNEPAPEPGGAYDPLVGKVLSGRYELQALLARGGMGKIYKAIQRPLGRPVALKVLDLMDDDREFRDRFFLEASLCARLSHPHTVRIYDYGTTDDGIFYIAMEYLEGESLHRLLAREAPLEPLRATRLMRQICGALAEAHDCGIVHRDLKPGNVFVTPHGEDREFVKVLDFGLVKELGKDSELSRTGSVLGSPMYISPEQVNGEPVDQRADIYTAGLILYYMLTGQTAFRQGNALALLMMQTHQAPPPFSEANPSVNLPALEWVVMRCLEKRPEKRFRSMHELIRAIKACEKELRGEVASPLKLALDDGMLVLPEGLEVSLEVRLPPEPVAPAAEPEHHTTLVTASSTRPVARVGLAVLLGGTAAALGFAVLVVVIALAVIGGTLATSEPTPPPPAPVVEERVEVPVPAGPVRVEVTLSSEPAGAEVTRDGVLLGTTPFQATLAEGEEWIVTVAAPGFEPRTLRMASDNPSPSVVLQPERKAGPRPAPAPVTPTPTPAPTPPAPGPRRPGGDIRDPWEDG